VKGNTDKMKFTFYILTAILLVQSLQGQENTVVQPALEDMGEFINIRDFTKATNNEEAYISIQSITADLSVLAKIINIDGHWGQPELVPFSGQYIDLEPMLTNQDRRLYFASNRPVDSTSITPKDFDIWYVEREHANAPWGKPINVGVPINSEHNEFYPSLAQNMNLYFTSDRSGTLGLDDIFMGAWKGAAYETPISLGESINTEGYEFNAFVSPNEAYLIFSGYDREEGYGSGDLYISFRDETGKWGPSTNMGKEINSKFMDYCPFVDHNNQTLYFTSRRSAIGGVLDLSSIGEVQNELQRYENGQSRIYRVAIDLNAFNPNH
jgi:hypothetical protein